MSNNPDYHPPHDGYDADELEIAKNFDEKT